MALADEIRACDSEMDKHDLFGERVGIERGFRLKDHWVKAGYSASSAKLDPWAYKPKTQEQFFAERALRDGYTQEEIDGYLAL